MFKKSSYSIALFLLTSTLIAGFLGCAEANPEKAFWKAEKLKREAIVRQGASPEQFEKARNEFQKFIENFPKSNLLDEARISIGELYAFEGKGPEAKKIFEVVVASSGTADEIQTRALFGLGQTLESEGKEKEALAVYYDLMRNHPTSKLGYRTPFYLARHPKDVFADLPRNARYQQAIEYYEKIVYVKPKSEEGLNAMGYLFQSHSDLGNWKKAIGVLKTIQRTFPGTREADLARQNEEKLKATHKIK